MSYVPPRSSASRKVDNAMNGIQDLARDEAKKAKAATEKAMRFSYFAISASLFAITFSAASFLVNTFL